MVSDKGAKCPKCGTPIQKTEEAVKPIEKEKKVIAEVESLKDDNPISDSSSLETNVHNIVLLCSIVVIAAIIGVNFLWNGKVMAAYEKQDKPIYSEELVKYAESGDAVAQCDLGVCYAKGSGIAQDSYEAFKWFKLSAEKGNENANADEYIRENFQFLLGKVFKPFEDVDAQQYFSLALRNPEVLNKPEEQELKKQIETENEGIRQIIDQYFYRAACDLGTNPSALAELPKVVPTPVEYIPNEFRTRYFFEAYMNSNFLVGCYKSTDHLNWIFGRIGKRDNMYNIRIDRDRDGGISKYKAKKAPDFLFLYNVDEPTTEGLMMFKIHNAADTPYEFMKKTNYPGLKEGRNYVSYILEQDPITFGDIDIVQLLNDYKSSHQDYKKGEPIYMLGRDLKQYRK